MGIITAMTCSQDTGIGVDFGELSEATTKQNDTVREEQKYGDV